MLLRVPAMVIVLIFRLDLPFRAKELSTLLRTDYQTTRGYLQDPSKPEVGLLTRTHRGWTLSAGGRQLILPGTPALELESAEKPRFFAESPATESLWPLPLPPKLYFANAILSV